jgi:rubrerythrin
MEDLAFAIRMEDDGETYYREQAERNRDNVLAPVFRVLAAAEGRHALLLRKLADGHETAWDEEEAAPRPNLFTGRGDFPADAFNHPDQAELYLDSMSLEQKSIDLYEAMGRAAADGPARKLFAFLVRQERIHLAWLEQLETLVRRPREWVEAAEFGPREDY